MLCIILLNYSYVSLKILFTIRLYEVDALIGISHYWENLFYWGFLCFFDIYLQNKQIINLGDFLCLLNLSY